MPYELLEALRKAGVTEDRMDAILAALPRPDASQWNPDPEYLYSLLKRSGLTLREASEVIAVSHRQMRYYLSGKRDRAPYTVQYALEMLALLNIPEKSPKRESPNEQGK